MSNPYASPTADSADQPKKRRFGLMFLFVFLIMFGGCAVGSFFYLTLSSPAPVPAPAPAPTVQPSE